MENLGVVLLFLLLIVFIGNVVYKESFADCNSPGSATWTLTVSPGGSSCNSGNSKGGTSGSKDGGSSTTNTTDGRKADSVDSLKSNSSSDGSSTAKKSSGIELSLTDLMALMSGSVKGCSANTPASAYNYRYVSASIPRPPAPPAPPAPQVYVIAGPPSRSLSSQFPSDLRTNTLDPVVGNYANRGALEGSSVQNYTPSASTATRQGVQYVMGAPANNPAENPEYIRRDSIPCYACSP